MSRLRVWAAPAIALAIVLAAGGLVAQDALLRIPRDATLWFGADAGLLWFVAVMLCVAGALGRRPREGLLFAVVAVAWVSPVFAAWPGGGGASAAAPAAATLGIAALWQLLLDESMHPTPLRRIAVGTVWALSLAFAVILLIFRNPFLDARCFSTCEPNPLLVTALPGVVAVTHTYADVLAVVVAAAALIWSARCLVRRCRITALAAAPALVTTGLIGAAAWLPRDGGPARGSMLEPIMAAALALLAVVGIVLGSLRLIRVAALRRLADDLASETAGDLRSRLADVFGVPGVDVLYPLDDDGWTDASGAVRAAPEGMDVAEIRREGTLIAVVIGLEDRAEELEAIGAAAGLAVDNERLRAGIAAHLVALRDSRLRVVEAGDAERRRIERNLHDGMQQSLLILQYELGLEGTRSGDQENSLALAALREEAHRITERLRDIAHGVFPAALDDLGVEGAVQRLVDEAPFPVDVVTHTRQRPARPVERTVYLVADEAVAAGARDHAAMRVEVTEAGNTVTVRTTNATSEASVGLRDRVDALGGRITAREDGLEVELPCASS